MSNDAADFYSEGCCYFKGTGGYPLNYNKALEYFQRAVELGSSDAMHALGLMYKDGCGVQKDPGAAVDLFYKAIATDPRNAFAAHALGEMYYNGSGVPRDCVKAYQFFKSSVELGLGNTTGIYPDSCFMTGLVLMEFYKNNAEAVPYFTEAAKYGNYPSAWHNLGVLCEAGAMNIPKSEIPGTAMSFYKEAADMGFVRSMDEIGRIYCAAQMFDQAMPWLQKAAAQGYGPAQKRLKIVQRVQQGTSIFDLFK